MGKLLKPGGRMVSALVALTLMIGLVPGTEAWAAKRITTGTIALSGTAVVGGKLTVSTKGWKPKRLTYSYQWYRSGTKIKYATKQTYRPTRLDLGRQLQIKVTAKKKGYKAKSRTVRLVNPIGRGRITPGQVWISNNTYAGNLLAVNMLWPNVGPAVGATFRYQWFRDGVAIIAPTATKDEYQSTSADAGRYLSVRVTASAPGYYSTTVTSPRRYISP